MEFNNFYSNIKRLQYNSVTQRDSRSEKFSETFQKMIIVLEDSCFSKVADSQNNYFRGVFRTQSNIYGDAFCEKN